MSSKESSGEGKGQEGRGQQGKGQGLGYSQIIYQFRVVYGSVIDVIHIQIQSTKGRRELNSIRSPQTSTLSSPCTVGPMLMLLVETEMASSLLLKHTTN